MASQEPQGQINKIFQDYLPGSPDPPSQGKLIEPIKVWKHAPPPPSLPPGLEYLSQLDQIIIHQQVELLEVILGTETCSKYEIKNHLGQRVYFAMEENGCFDRNFCSPIRSFTIRITDNTGREVITVNRPLRCNSCWFPCYMQELEVQSPPGTIVGYVVQKWDPLLPKFTILNESKEDVLKIIGPYATCSCFGDVDFEVKTLNEMSTIGKISKFWSGFVNNVFTNAANFGIQVPIDLDVKIKAIMIGACFLIVSTQNQREKPRQAR
ncbi:phospholipid scramblase family member 5 isoform X1 [Pelodiscus sinensis]|uniref:phospholipid scramblase family member 5 isoform X1 n=1 Tax=Pelodiscus sinensis TaxID=13735 RepID=UPI0003C4DA51|nr:phospholipid scramblase family member 5 isoform X1 [Pelodiscus sinensis]|eukprot:XP_006116340.1 phospholipid scramblase family member 5 isoform X1 [Pelodiscus sinensis]